MSPITSILVATDFTECSAQALREGIRLAAATGARVQVVHVIDTLVVVDIEKARWPFQEKIEEGLAREVTAAWQSFAKDIPGASGVPFSVRVNNRVVGIETAARDLHADLLVLGAFGNRKPDVGAGTVATGCVRQSPVDVLLVRDTHHGPFKRVVCAVDFSDTSRLALQRAAQLASVDAAELHVLHVFDPAWNQLPPLLLSSIKPTHNADVRADVDRHLSEFVSAALAAQPTSQPIVRCYADAGYRSGITQYASDVGADLVVLGTRGRSNLRDMCLGSTAEKTLARSKCSILAVKPAAS